jgi:energy-coupling factor transport system permease protein
VTWIIWTGTAAAIAMLTRNPMYLSLLLGVVAVHYASISRRHPQDRGWRMLLRITLGMTLLIVPFNALNIHIGTHVLFRLPSDWPLIGGNVTLEGTIAGFSSALGLLTLITLFATLNLRIDQAQMLRLTPAFIYEAGLIVSIALTFIPQMMLSAQEIREAQLIRGHKMRRVRDMLPFVVALLTTGLERSFQLAESMEARGFGNVRNMSRKRDLLYKGLVLLGLAGFFSGFFALTYFASLRLIGWIGVALSTILLLGVFWAQGRRVLRVHYRHSRWTWRDAVALAPTALAIGTLVFARLREEGSLSYNPYQELLPPFQPWLGAALVALAIPALFDLSRKRTRLDGPTNA